MLTDAEIQTLLSDPKRLPKNALQKLSDPKKLVSRSLRAVVKCKGESGKQYSILASLGPGTKYSIHIRYHPSGRRKPVTLIRCNSPHAPHRNTLERTVIKGGVCHVHHLTERYQRNAPPRKALSYAEETGRYKCFRSAIEHVCYSYGFFFKSHKYKDRFPLFPDKDP